MLSDPPFSTPLIRIELPETIKAGVSLWVKRDDLIHPQVSGNKWRKLKYNLLEARSQGYSKILTFGGAFSNHIYSVAAAGKLWGFKTTGIIRGEETIPLNPTLFFARTCGMQLRYMDRSRYRQKNSSEVTEILKQEYPDFYLVPEGGTNELAVKGVAELVKEIDIPFDYITTACGTGGTLSGLASGLDLGQNAVGIAALAGAGFLEEEVRKLTGISQNNWQIIHDYHFGGYAKITRELVLFVRDFETQTGIPLDPVYTGKMMYGVYDLIKQGFFEKGKTIIALHTGGLQGIAGMKSRIDKLLKNQ
jgi:1-aminocyclopropane-1-carboxylate deaminase